MCIRDSGKAYQIYEQASHIPPDTTQSAAKIIKKEFEPFLTENRITKNIGYGEIFKEYSPFSGAAAGGTNLFGGATILITHGFYEADKDACNFAVKHEIGHIKHNDCIVIPSVVATCQVATIFFGFGICSLSGVYVVVLIILGNIIVEGLFRQSQEGKADDFAIKTSSNEELQGGRRFFVALQESFIEKRNTRFWSRIVYSSGGENRLDVFHPSLAGRIQKIENALQLRGVEIDSIDREKFDHLKTVLVA